MLFRTSRTGPASAVTDVTNSERLTGCSDVPGSKRERGDYCTRPTAARDLLKTAATPVNAGKALSAADTTLADGVKRPDWGAVAPRVRVESYAAL